MMRWIVACVAFLSVSGVRGQSLPEALALFDEGTTHVEGGRYTQAIASFDAALEAGFQSSALHYNRGIALYRLDHLGQAIASFERARLIDPDDRMILHNLSIARTRLGDNMSRIPEPFLARIWRWLDRRIGALALFLVGGLAYLTWCGLMLARIVGRPYTEWTRRIAWSAALFAVVGVGLGLGVSLRPAERPAAVVGADATPVFPAPAAAQSPDLEIHEGLTVSILGVSGDWTSVRLPNGVTGWVRTEDLIEV